MIRGAEEAINVLNELAAEMMGRSRRRKSFVWWNSPRGWQKTKYAFGYTPWKTKDDETGKTGFFALKYRILKNGMFKLVKSVRFGKRKTAKKRALQWYNKFYRSAET